MRSGLRVFGHPVHVMLVHYPLAFLGVAVLLDCVGLWRGTGSWWAISFWSIVLGLVAAAPAVVTGFVDYVTAVSGARAERAGMMHMLVMLSALGLFGISLVCRGGTMPDIAIREWGATACDAAGAALLGLGGWFGGELVLHYDVGRRADAASAEEHGADR